MFQYLHGKHRALCFVKLSIRIMIFSFHTPRRRLKILHGKASISARADSSRRRSQHRTFRQCVQFINQTPPKIYTSNLRKKIFFVLSPPDTQKNKKLYIPNKCNYFASTAYVLRRCSFTPLFYHNSLAKGIP